MCTCNIAISFAVLQVIGYVFIPSTTIDSNLSLSVSVGVHVCACLGAYYVYATVGMCVHAIVGMFYVYIGWYVGV